MCVTTRCYSELVFLVKVPLDLSYLEHKGAIVIGATLSVIHVLVSCNLPWGSTT